MNDAERYDDPVLARRVKEWMASAAPVAAPERLVFAVMDQVGRAPGRPRRLAWSPIPATFAQHLALGLVIAIGVAGGILIARVPDIGTKPTLTPSSPGSLPSLRLGTQSQVDGLVFAEGGTGLWVATSRNQLLQLGPEGTALDTPVNVAIAATDITVQQGAAGRDVGSADLVWLVAPGADLTRFQSNAGETYSVPGTAGDRVASGAGAIWVGRADEIVKVVDAGGSTPLAVFPAPGHASSDPIAVIGNELWVVDASGIQRLDPASGVVLGRVDARSSVLLPVGDLVWAGQGIDLVALDPASGQARVTASIPADARPFVALAADAQTLWVLAGAESGRRLIGIDPETGATRSVTSVPGGTRSIVALPGAVWTLDTEGRIGRYSPTG